MSYSFNMKASFTIPGRLPGLNDLIKKAYCNRYAANNLKKKTQKLIGQYIIADRIPVFKAPVMIHFQWIEPNRRRDLDNICGGGRKYILDALVECGKLKNDSRKFVTGFSDSFPEPDEINPRIVVVLSSALV